MASIRAIASRKLLSPLKKVKRKVGYRCAEESEEEGEGSVEPPQKAMRRLTLEDDVARVASGSSDVAMI